MAKFENHAFYHALIEAFGGTGCAICRLQARAARRCIDIVLFESVTAVEFRRRFRQARGFCPRHARLMGEFANALGSSILYRDILADAADRWRAHAAKGGKLKPPRGLCPACFDEEKVFANFREAAFARASDADFQNAWRASDGLCVEHFEALVARAPSAPRKIICAIEADKAAAIVARLDEFIRKSDYRFASEPRGDEGRAWLDAVDKCAGGVADE